MSKRLFKATLADDPRAREKSHQFLADYLAQHRFSLAECREDGGAGEYEVWDGPQPPRVGKPGTQPEATSYESEAFANRVAELVVAKLKEAING